MKKLPTNIVVIHILALLAFPVLIFFSLPSNGLAVTDAEIPQPPSVLRVMEKEDQILSIRTQVRHTTVIVLPQAETILDFVIGDGDYWHLTGSANVAYVKPLAQDLETNVTLVCASGRIYAFLVSESAKPHLVVRIEREDKKRKNDRPIKPAFVARSMVEGYQRAAQQAADAAQAASENADKQVAAARQQAQTTVHQFRAAYPQKLRWPYRLERAAFQEPFSVEAMWADHKFTYLRSVAQEAPALYELKDGKPSLVAYDLEDDGLFIVRHILGDGWLQIGEKKAKWRFVPEEH